jgi:hypothetical protein
MVSANYVILGGPQFAIKEEKLIVGLLTTRRLKYCKELNMICQ